MSSRGSYDQRRPPTLSMRDNSHMISKPKIRIVHIFAPEIIKTDVANFRDLVQRLTGKPAKRIGSRKKVKAAAAAVGTNELAKAAPSCGWRIKGEFEEEGGRGMWKVEENSGGGFLSGLGDVDGFFQGLSDFPLLPFTSSHMDVIGEAHVT